MLFLPLLTRRIEGVFVVVDEEAGGMLVMWSGIYVVGSFSGNEAEFGGFHMLLIFCYARG